MAQVLLAPRLPSPGPGCVQRSRTRRQRSRPEEIAWRAERKGGGTGREGGSRSRGLGTATQKDTGIDRPGTSNSPCMLRGLNTRAMGEEEWDPYRISLSYPTTLPRHPVISRNHNEPTSIPSRAPPGPSPSHEPLPPADRSFWPRSVHGLGSALTSLLPFPGPTPCPLRCSLPKSKYPSPLLALKLSVSFPFLGPPKGIPIQNKPQIST